MIDRDPVTAWRADLAWYLGIAIASGLAFGIGQGLVAGLLAGATMLAFTIVLALGRRRIDAIRVVGGAGDERNRDLYMRSLAVAGGVLGLATGALVPHLAFAVAQRSLVEIPLWLDLLGDLIFTSGTVALVRAGWLAVGRPASPSPQKPALAA